MKTIDEYIAQFPADIRVILEKLRDTIKMAAPDAEEVISYQMPAYKYKGILVWFAAHKNHIGLYPASSGIKAFEQELAAYQYSKGAVQFPIGNPLPLELISRMVKFRVEENMANEEAKKLAKRMKRLS